MIQNISERNVVWVVWQNTDLTEGKGAQVPIKICKSLTTALRWGKANDVQGSDCMVTKEMVFKIEGSDRIYGIVAIEGATKDDKEHDEIRDRRAAIVARALELGLTDEEIELLDRGK